jgi:hypothetical protein
VILFSISSRTVLDEERRGEERRGEERRGEERRGEEVKRPWCEPGHSPPASAEAKNTWIYTPIPHAPSWRIS